MKTETRNAAANAAHEIVKNAISSLVPVLVAKKEGYALDTGVKDENGKPIYAVIDVTVKNTEDTKTATAFDLEACVQALQDKMNAPKKETKSKKAPDPKMEAKRAAHAARQDALEKWCLENLPCGEGLTATQIKELVPELAEVTIMQVGTYLKNIAAKNPTVQRDVVKGKPLYSLA